MSAQAEPSQGMDGAAKHVVSDSEDVLSSAPELANEEGDVQSGDYDAATVERIYRYVVRTCVVSIRYEMALTSLDVQKIRSQNHSSSVNQRNNSLLLSHH